MVALPTGFFAVFFAYPIVTILDLGLGRRGRHDIFDLVTDEQWTWQRDSYVRLGPEVEPVHVLSVRRPW